MYSLKRNVSSDFLAQFILWASGSFSLPVPLSSRTPPAATPDLKCCQRTFLAAVWMAGSPIRWGSWRGLSRPSIAGMNRDELFCFLEKGNIIQLNSVGSRQLIDHRSGCSVTTWHVWGPGRYVASHQMLCPATLSAAGFIWWVAWWGPCQRRFSQSHS